jgi:hypothetical protein
MYSGRIDPIVFVALAVVVGGCLFSFWKGGRIERIGGAVVLANIVLVLTVALFVPTAAQPVAELVIDGLTAMALLAVVLMSGSLWLGGAMLLYALLFTMHAFYFVTERAPDRLHAIVNNADTLGVILCLVVGTAVAWRRRAVAAATAGAHSAA